MAAILLQAANIVSRAQGCQLYLVSRDQAQADAVWITEVWNSRQDHDNSLQNPEIGALIARALPLLEGKPEKGQVLEVLGGAGLSAA